MDLQIQYEKLLRYCYMKINDRNLAEDIVQETFLRFWQSHSYKDTGKELAYLYTIARNLCMDEFRKKPMEDIDDYEELRAERFYEPETRLDTIAIEQMLEQLPEELREIIVLRYVNDVSVADIGKIMNMSRFAVHRRMKDGLSMLKKLYEEGVDIS